MAFSAPFGFLPPLRGRTKAVVAPGLCFRHITKGKASDSRLSITEELVDQQPNDTLTVNRVLMTGTSPSTHSPGPSMRSSRTVAKGGKW